MKMHSVPDICLIGINRPCMGSLETAIRMKREWPEIKILFVSMLNSDDYAYNLKKIGVAGLLSKRAPFAELHDALSNLMEKQQAFPE